VSNRSKASCSKARFIDPDYRESVAIAEMLTVLRS
jgi:hypothetical protein